MKSLLLSLAFASSMAFAGPAAVPEHLKTKLTFDRVPVTELVKIIYTEVLKKPFVLSSAVLARGEVLTLSFDGSKNSQVKDLLTSSLNASGYQVIDRGGVDFIDVKGTVLEEKQVLVYFPKNRSSTYLLPLLSGFFKGIAASASQAAAGEALVYEGSARERASLVKLLDQLDTPVGQVEVRAAIFQFSTDARSAWGVKALGDLFNGQLNVSAGGGTSGNVFKFKLDLGFDTILSALQGDSRFKVISRPFVRVKDGGHATFQTGDETPVLGAVIAAKDGNFQQSVEYKPSGTILDVSPVVRSDSVDLSLRQTLSNFTTTNTGVSASPTLVKREVSTSLTVAPGEVLVIGGLTDEKDSQDQSGLFDVVLGRSKTKTQSELVMLLQVQKI